MKTKIFALILSLALLASMATFSFTASAKDMNLPPGADKIVYYTGGGASILTYLQVYQIILLQRL